MHRVDRFTSPPPKVVLGLRLNSKAPTILQKQFSIIAQYVCSKIMYHYKISMNVILYYLYQIWYCKKMHQKNIKVIIVTFLQADYFALFFNPSCFDDQLWLSVRPYARTFVINSNVFLASLLCTMSSFHLIVRQKMWF